MHLPSVSGASWLGYTVNGTKELSVLVGEIEAAMSVIVRPAEDCGSVRVVEEATPGDVDAVTAVAVTSGTVMLIKVTSFVIADWSVGVADDIVACVVVMSLEVVAIITSEADGEDNVTVVVMTSEGLANDIEAVVVVTSEAVVDVTVGVDGNCDGIATSVGTAEDIVKVGVIILVGTSL